MCIKLKKNGFTLVELLAVLVILAVILIVALPSITSSLNKSDEEALEKRKQMILSEAELKLDDASKANLRTNACSYSVSDLINMDIISEVDGKDQNGNVIDMCVGYNINNELDIVNCIACP